MVLLLSCTFIAPYMMFVRMICHPNIVTAHTVRSFLSRLEEKKSMSRTQKNCIIIYLSIISTIAIVKLISVVLRSIDPIDVNTIN